MLAFQAVSVLLWLTDDDGRRGGATRRGRGRLTKRVARLTAGWSVTMLGVRRMTLETRCPECDVHVKIENREVILTLITDDHGEYRFRCPECKQAVTKLADAEVLSRLRQAGIRAVNADAEPGSRRGGPPLSEDDLIEFGRSLEGGDPWAELDGRSSLPG